MKRTALFLIVIISASAGCSDPSSNETLPLTSEDLKTVVPSTPPLTEPGPEDPDAPAEFTTTESGLKYRILRQSKKRKPNASHAVHVHYKGTLDDGSVFDSTYSRGRPAVFVLANVIPGWREGLKLIGIGGMIELEIPSELGYGAKGHGDGIPPNSRLHFIIELLRIEEVP